MTDIPRQPSHPTGLAAGSDRARLGRRPHRHNPSCLAERSLGVVIGGVMLAMLGLYWRADPATHLGSYYGNAAADWLGSFVTVVATKFWFERGSPESRVPSALRGRGPRFLHEHSLT